MWNPMESPESTWDSDPPEVPWRASVCLQPSNRSCNPWCSAVWSRSQGLGKILGKRRREAELDCQKRHLGMKTPMELQNPMELRGVWRNLQAVTSHIFSGKSDNNSPFSARCSIVGGFHMTAQASQLRGLAVDSDYSGWSSRGISLWQAACNVPLWTCLLGIPSRPRMV